MQWIAPSEKDSDNAALEKRLWDAADIETMRLLLDLGANPKPLNWTPLHHAVATWQFVRSGTNSADSHGDQFDQPSFSSLAVVAGVHSWGPECEQSGT